MGSQHVAFLLFRAGFSTTFLKNCGRDVSLGTATRLKTVVGVSKGILPVKYFLLQQSHILCQSNFMDTIRHIEMR